MILTASDVHWIDASGHPWSDCILMHKTFFHHYVAKVTSKSDRFEGKWKMNNVLDSVSVSKNGNVEIHATTKAGDQIHLRAADQHVFLSKQIPGTFEYDIFEGRPNNGRWNLTQTALEILGDALHGWYLQRLEFDAYGEGQHALFMVFQLEIDSILFAATFEGLLQKAGYKQGRK